MRLRRERPVGRDPLPPRAPVPATVQTLAFWRHPLAYLEWCRSRYGSRFTIKPVGLPPLVFMSEPADIKTLLLAPAHVLHPGAGGAPITPLVGERSFMLAEEDEHLEGRRAILPAFHHKVVIAHADMVRELASRDIATWPRDRPIAIHNHLRSLTLKVILKTIFGDAPQISELHTRLISMFHITASLALQEPQLRHLPRWRGKWCRFLTDRARVNEIISRLIADQCHKQATDSGLLAMLLEQHSSGSNERSKNEGLISSLMSVILAGHETTASELAWAFQLLSHDTTISTHLLDDLAHGSDQYLTATVQEVLLHRPVFIFTIPRAVHHPVCIAGTTFHPPAQLLGSIYLMHHDPKLYPEPQAFRPERFLDSPPDPAIWMPWGGGRKRCPGHRLATLEMSTILRTVLSECDIMPAAERLETARWRSVIVTPEHGSRIILRARTASHPIASILQRRSVISPTDGRGKSLPTRFLADSIRPRLKF